jgi:uncharacterized C2H2 Zn-finger protein
VRELRCEKCGLINGHFLKVQDYRRHVKEGTFDAIKEDRKAKLIAAALRQGKIVEVIGE